MRGLLIMADCAANLVMACIYQTHKTFKLSNYTCTKYSAWQSDMPKVIVYLEYIQNRTRDTCRPPFLTYPLFSIALQEKSLTFFFFLWTELQWPLLNLCFMLCGSCKTMAFAAMSLKKIAISKIIISSYVNRAGYPTKTIDTFDFCQQLFHMLTRHYLLSLQCDEYGNCRDTHVISVTHSGGSTNFQCFALTGALRQYLLY